jgi:class 3 adenylate cyclase/uncharacterized protein YdcH (DUF465 family)
MNQLAAKLLSANADEAETLAKDAAEEANEIQYPQGRAYALLQAGMAAYAQRNFPTAKEYYHQSLGIFETLCNTEKTALILAKLGNICLFSGEYNEALNYYARAISLREQLGDDQGQADLFTNSGIIYGMQGNYPLALKNHLNALRIFEKGSDVGRIASSCSNIGIIYYEQHNFDAALKMYERALAIRQQAGDMKAVSEAMNNIALVYNDQGKFEEALTMHKQALLLREQTGDKSRIAISYSNLADVYKATKEYTTALDYYNHALTLFEELNDKRGLVPAYFNIGELYFIIGEYEKAERFLNNAITLAEQTGLRDHLREAYEYMAKLQANQGKFEAAYRLHVRYAQLDKEISNAETSRQIAQMTMRHEIEQKEREAEIERQKNIELTKAYESLDAEKKRSETLLLNILPEEVAQELKQSGKATAKYYNDVTILFTDFVGFTKVSMLLTPQQLVDELHECFKGFDEIIAEYNIEKIKTVGDAYMAAAGLPTANAEHAADILKASLEIVEFMKRRRKQMGEATFEVRVGVHSGSVVAGIVGVTKFAYDIWGDAVNTAARMEQNSEPGRVNVSQATFELLSAHPKFKFEYRGEIEAKNKGKMKMYFATTVK